MMTFLSFLIIFSIDYGIDPLIIKYFLLMVEHLKELAIELLKGEELSSAAGNLNSLKESFPATNTYSKESSLDSLDTSKLRKDDYLLIENYRKPLPYTYRYMEHIYLYVAFFVLVEVIFNR
jgi:hypothetical protein